MEKTITAQILAQVETKIAEIYQEINKYSQAPINMVRKWRDQEKGWREQEVKFAHRMQDKIATLKKDLDSSACKCSNERKQGREEERLATLYQTLTYLTNTKCFRYNNDLGELDDAGQKTGQEEPGLSLKQQRVEETPVSQAKEYLVDRKNAEANKWDRTPKTLKFFLEKLHTFFLMRAKSY